MRIRRLDLVRYGRFTEQELELPPATPDLHIVVGANEAGKSTILSGIEDLLFGIHPRSPMNFVHAYRSMMLGATLEANGDRLEMRRRKGNKNTILKTDDTPMVQGELVLMPFLANANRSFFERMFSLDHERLRRGGKEILDDRNEVGHMLFSASSGIQDLRGRLDALNKESDRLWAKRRSAKRWFYQAEDRLKTAERQLREQTVSAAKWRDLKRRFESCKEEHRQLGTEIQAKDAALRKLGRIRRVARYIQEKSSLEAAMAKLRGVVDLPSDAGERLRKAEQELRLAARRLDEQRKELKDARTSKEALTWNAALVLRKEDIDRLHEQRIQVQAERSDLPKRLRDLANAEQQIRERATDLGWESEDVSVLIRRIPSRTKVDGCRTLLHRREQRIEAVKTGKSTLDDAKLRLCELKQQANEIGSPMDVSRLEAVLAATNLEIGSHVRTAEHESSEAQAELERQFGDLRPRPSSVESADTLEVPARGAVEAFRDNRRESDQRLRDCRREMQSAEKNLARRIKMRDRFVDEEQPVRPGDVARLRQERDAQWSLIRRRYIDHEVISLGELQRLTKRHDGIASAYESAVESADEAADRRLKTAEEAAELAELERSISDGRDTVDALKQQWSDLTKNSQALSGRWRELWHALPFEPLDPDAMLRWLDVQTSLRTAVKRRGVARRHVEELRRQAAEADRRLRSELEALGLTSLAPPEHGLQVIVHHAEQFHRNHQQSKEATKRLALEIVRAESEVKRQQTRLSGAEGEREKWLEEWRRAVAELGLDFESKPEVISDQVGLIDQLRVPAATVTDLQMNRIGKIERDIRDFRDESRRVFRAVAPDLADADPFDAVSVLEQRLAQDIQTKRGARRREKEIASRTRRIRALEREAGDAQAVIEDLQSLAGVNDTDALREEIAKAEQFKEYEAGLTEVINVLEQQGDGLSIGDLESECANVDLDEAASREKAVGEEITQLRDRQLEARDRLRIAEGEFEQIGGSDGAAIAESARQEALAEIQDVAERYVRSRTASLLLQWAIDRHRREKQAPILKKASRLFAQLTLGSFEKLELDFDDDRPQLVGRRPSGERVRVRGMSDGSVDQLYLALRVAALEEYLDQAPALPFVADDLFINFDDDRAAAGLRVLAQLARSCQVIFFTHHEHLVDIARNALPQTAPVLRMPR